MRLSTVAILLVLSLGCGSGESGDGQSPATEGSLRVHTVNYPLAAFVERIGGDAVSVSFPVPDDVDPAFWEPSPEEIARFAEADILLLNGAGYAKWTRTASLPDSRTIDTSRGFNDPLISMEAGVSHTHGPEGDHVHGETAFTVWLDPTLAMQQARAIAAAFIERRPAETARFEANLAALEKDLADLDRGFAEALDNMANTPIVFSHPVYQYLERRYRLSGRSVHWEPDVEPTAEGWQELGELLTAHEARLMIWEGEPIPATRGRLRESGIHCVVVDPCGNRPESGDFFSVMRDNVDRLRAANR